MNVAQLTLDAWQFIREAPLAKIEKVKQGDKYFTESKSSDE